MKSVLYRIIHESLFKKYTKLIDCKYIYIYIKNEKIKKNIMDTNPCWYDFNVNRKDTDGIKSLGFG